jgi:hypothetical protein
MKLTHVLAGLGVLGVATAGFVELVNRRQDRRIQREVDQLLAAAGDCDGHYSSADLAGLPDPVQRYFETVLTDGQPYVRTARLQQDGEVLLGDADGEYKPLTATQHVTVDPPGFVWDADVEMAPLVSARVIDAYAEGGGWLRATLFGSITVADVESNPQMNEGELLRYLAEAVWLPTALLPACGVTWEPIDDATARMTLEHAGSTASLDVHFDDQGHVERVHGERYRQEDDAYAPWTGYFREYRTYDGMAIPTAGEVEWNLPEGDRPYWRGRIVDVEYQPAP